MATGSAVRATATIHVTVEVELHQPWGGASSVDEIRRSASKQAEEAIRSAIELARRDSPMLASVGKARVVRSVLGVVTITEAISLGDGTG